MTDSSAFSPDWVSPPGDSIAEIVQDRGLSIQEFSSRLGVSLSTATDLLHGMAPLTAELAHSLQVLLGTPAAFWLRREAQYRHSLSPKASKAIERRYQAWLREIPLSDMAKFGWVTRRKLPADQVSECLDFFGASTISEWMASSEDFMRAAALRTSRTVVSKPAALHAWLRRGEIVAGEIQCAPWNADLLRAALPELRGLTRTREPAKFIPELTRICAASGVALVVARTPNGCRASGAVKALRGQNKALILMSFRYLSDDHFWFTFFHEVGHLLLHFDRGLFLEGSGGDEPDTLEEEQANEFSARVLVPTEHVGEMRALDCTPFAVARFAKRIGISPGIVVGQLQHLKLVPPQHLNNLKTRYSWS